MFNGFSYRTFFTDDTKQRLSIIEKAMDHILSQDDGKERYIRNVTEMTKAFALVIPDPSSLRIRDDVGFFQAVRSALIKNTESRRVDSGESETAIKQILSKALVSDRVIDIFAAAGLNKPDISILSDEFLAGVKDMPQKNLSLLDSFFLNLEKEFQIARKETFDYLKANWNNIIKEIKTKYPSLNINDAMLASLEPEDLKFIEMDYSTRTLSKMLSEMGDLKELFSRGAASDPDIARRIESQKDALIAQLKEEYEDKLTNLEDTIKKLTSVGKGKRYDKVVGQVGKMLEDVDSVQEIVGEDMGLADKL
jgi:type I site-specific restriction-modification system R (restriction) subunit